MRFFRELKVWLEFYWRWYRKYLPLFLWSFFVVAVIHGIESAFQSEYIKLVNYFGKLIPFAYLVFVGISISNIFFGLFWDVIHEFSNKESIRTLAIADQRAFYSALIINAFIANITNVIIIWLIFHFAFQLPVNYLILSVLSVFIAIPFSMALALIFRAIVLRKKRDGVSIAAILSNAMDYLLPVTFSLAVLYPLVREVVEILLPLAAIIEETRKLLILGNFNVTILILAIIVSFTYLAFAISYYLYTWDKGRKEGWLYLE